MRPGHAATVLALVGLALVAPTRVDADVITFDFSGTPGPTLSFSGTFTNDNDIALVYLTLPTEADILASTSSAAAGGFDPVLSLFDPAGQLLIQDDDNPDGSGLDSLLNSADLLGAPLGPGVYVLALTQSFNYARTTLADGFDLGDTPQFTCADPASADAGCFTDWLGETRNGTFAGSVTIPSSTPATPVPEPATLALTLAGLLVALTRRRTMSP